MIRVSQARQHDPMAGEPIITPISVLSQNKFYLRRGTLCLIAAGPGTGKSALIQAITQRGDDNGTVNSTFYFSADSSAFDMYTRSAAIATGRTTDDIEGELNKFGSDRLDPIVDAATKHMWFSYKSDPSDQYIVDQLQAYAELAGAWPEIIVIDNLKNCVVGDGVDEFRALEDTSVFLHDLAKDTGACVIALHHVRGDLEDGYSQIPLSGIRGKISKTPSSIWTLFKGAHSLNVSVVKNRGGRADASGSLYASLVADLSRMSFQG